MICWLLEWSEHRYYSQDEGLRDCGVRFVRALLEKHGTNLDAEIEKVEIHPQERSIDVLVRINGEQVLLIEDKMVTKDHDKQLSKYYNYVIEGRTQLRAVLERDLHPIYLKTGNQALADDHRVEKTKKYKVFNRADFLTVLNPYRGRHSILLDFRQYLQELEDETKSGAEWTRDAGRERKNAWEGFYRRLEGELSNGTRREIGWGDVPNQSGGFLGFWWWPSDKDVIYLQIEGGPGKKARLCFKVYAEEANSEEQYNLKWYWNARILAAGRATSGQAGRDEKGQDHDRGVVEG